MTKKVKPPGPAQYREYWQAIVNKANEIAELLDAVPLGENERDNLKRKIIVVAQVAEENADALDAQKGRDQ